MNGGIISSRLRAGMLPIIVLDGRAQKLTLLLVFLIFLLSTAASFALLQKSSTDAVLDSLFATAGFRQVAVSPDGKRVAWIVTLTQTNGTPSPDSGIYVVSLLPTSAAPWRITAGRPGADYQDIAWCAIWNSFHRTRT